MSSPKSKASKLFKLDRPPSSGMFKLPRRSSAVSSLPYPEDELSQVSDDSTLRDELYESNGNNKLSGDISATVKLTTRMNNKGMYQQPLMTRSSPLIDVSRNRPNLQANQYKSTQSASAVIPMSLQRGNDDYKDAEAHPYSFYKAVSRFDLLEISALIYSLFRSIIVRALSLLKTSKYVTWERNGKIHFYSFSYGVGFGLFMIVLKPLLFRSLNYVASMTAHVVLCVILLTLISISLTANGKSVPETANGSAISKKIDAREFYTNRPALDPIKSSQLPLVNPIHSADRRRGSDDSSFRTNSAPTSLFYKTSNSSADAFIAATAASQRRNRIEEEGDGESEDDEGYEDDGADRDDDNKSVFSVATNAQSNLYNSKRNYNSFIEQTKKVKQTC